MKLQTTKGATPVSTPTPDPIELDSKALDDPARYGRLPYRCTIIAIVLGHGREKLEGKDGSSVDSMCRPSGGRPSNDKAGRARDTLGARPCVPGVRVRSTVRGT